jgi:hypothetical protein
MTPKGAEMVIESLSLRVFEIQDRRAKLEAEETQLAARIKELEMIRDAGAPVVATRIISVGPDGTWNLP